MGGQARCWWDLCVCLCVCWERVRAVILFISSAPALWFLWGTDVHNLIQCLIPLYSLSPVPAPPTVCTHTSSHTHIVSWETVIYSNDFLMWIYGAYSPAHSGLFSFFLFYFFFFFLLSISLCAKAVYPVLESTLDLIRCHFPLCQFALLLVRCDHVIPACTQSGQRKHTDASTTCKCFC